MSRTHGLIVVVAALAAFVAVLYPSGQGIEDVIPPPPESVPDDRPDLVMGGARIRQFDARGDLEYRLRAQRIEYLPHGKRTKLTQPELELFGVGQAPWRVTAERGTIDLAGESDEIAAAGTPVTTRDGPNAERVYLEDNVHVRRERADGEFLDVRAQSLTLYPQAEYAYSDRPVTIRTRGSETLASGFQADLDGGRLTLQSRADAPVHTRLDPEWIDYP